MSISLRTVAQDGPFEEVQKEYDRLMKVWKRIVAKAKRVRSVTLIHEEESGLKRSLRD